MPKISSKTKTDEPRVKVRVVLETEVPASLFMVAVYDPESEASGTHEHPISERPAINAEEVLEVLQYGGTNAWSYSWEWDLWTYEDKMSWELEVTDVES